MSPYLSIDFAYTGRFLKNKYLLCDVHIVHDFASDCERYCLTVSLFLFLGDL